MPAVRKIGEISHPYRRPVDSEWRIARRMPPQRLIRHAEAPELARSLGRAHIEEHQDEPHLSGDSSAQMKEPEIVESVAVRPSVAGLEVTQLSGVRRILDVPDEHPFAERRPELSAPVWRDGFERRRQQLATERDLKCPRAGRSGNEANVLRRGRLGDIEDRPAAVPEVTDVEKVLAVLDCQRELEPGPPVEAVIGNRLERSLGSCDPVCGGHRSYLFSRYLWRCSLLDQCSAGGWPAVMTVSRSRSASSRSASPPYFKGGVTPAGSGTCATFSVIDTGL